MLSPLPRRSDWAYCFAHFTQPCQPSLIWQSGRPAHCPFRGLLGVHSRYGLHTRAVTVFRDTLSEGFSHFVTSIAAPVASGWSGCRVGFAPTGKRRLFTAHAMSRHWPNASNDRVSVRWPRLLRPTAICQTGSNLFATFLCSHCNSHASNVSNRGRNDVASVHRTDAFRRPS